MAEFIRGLPWSAIWGSLAIAMGVLAANSSGTTKVIAASIGAFAGAMNTFTDPVRLPKPGPDEKL